MTPAEEAALGELEEALRLRPPAPRTFREMARALGVSHGTVQNIEARAIAKLRKLAKKGWEPHE